MTRLRTGTSLFAVFVLAISCLWGQEPGPGSKSKTRLPMYWSKLGLSDAQRAKINAIRADYQAKIEALKEQIKRLENQEQAELTKVLTSEQRAQLKKILASKSGVDADDASSKEERKTKSKEP